MDKKQLNIYKKKLEELERVSEHEKLKEKIHLLANDRHLVAYNKKLTISGFHIKLAEYDEPVFKGFKRSEEAVQKGVEARQASLEIKEQMQEDFRKFGERFASATKDNEEAIRELEKLKRKYSDDIKVREDNERRKINALKAKIQANFDIWTHFVTVSFRNNETDIKKAKKRLEKFIEKIRKDIDPEFKYVYVTEFQKRGAIHFHMVVSIWNGQQFPKAKFIELCDLWRGKSKKSEEKDGINVKGIKYKYNRHIAKGHKQKAAAQLGELSTQEQIQIVWSVGSYLTSYLKKDAGNVLLFGSQIYGASAGLKDQIVITDEKKIEQILLGLGVAQLKEKSYKIPKRYVDESGNLVESDSFITMHYYNMLIKKQDVK